MADNLVQRRLARSIGDRGGDVDVARAVVDEARVIVG